MSTLADASAAPETIEVDGTEYACRPLTLGDFSALERKIVTSLYQGTIEAAMAAASAVEGETEKQMIVQQAMEEGRRIQKLSFADDESDLLASHLMRIETLAFALSLSLKRGGHKEASTAWVFEKFDQPQIARIMRTILERSGLMVDAEEDPQGEAAGGAEKKSDP